MNQAAVEEARESDVVGVVGLRPPELVGERPGFMLEAARCHALDRGRESAT